MGNYGLKIHVCPYPLTNNDSYGIEIMSLRQSFKTNWSTETQNSACAHRDMVTILTPGSVCKPTCTSIYQTSSRLKSFRIIQTLQTPTI